MAKHLASCQGCPENQKLLVNKALEKFGTTKSQKRKVDEAFDDDTASISSTLSSASTCSGTSGTSSASNSGNFKNMSEFVDRKMTEQDQKYGHILLATAIYASGSPLMLSENIYWQKFLEFLRPAFKIPSRHDVSNPLP